MVRGTNFTHSPCRPTEHIATTRPTAELPCLVSSLSSRNSQLMSFWSDWRRLSVCNHISTQCNATWLFCNKKYADQHFYSASALLTMQIAVIAGAILSVRPSVTSVTFRCFVQMNEDTIVRFSVSRCSATAERPRCRVRQFWPKVEDWNWKTIFYGHYRSIFNHCDIIGLQSYRIRWKTAK